MTDSPKTPETPADEQPFETYYDDAEHAADGGKHRWDARKAVCDTARRVEDQVLKTLPLPVTEHLVAGRNEFIKAGIALAEEMMHKGDSALQRARDLHAPKSS